MNREAQRRAGITLMPKGPRSSYRSYAQQVYFWNVYRRGGSPAARPGRSNHGWGKAVDIQTQAMAKFVVRHGARFGWNNVEGRGVGEWWHMGYVGGYRGADPGAGPALPTLRAGAKGKTVRELQAHLARKGYKLVATGVFDEPTRAAVLHYQRRKGMTADGIVGPLTWQRLRARPPVLRRGDSGDGVLRLQRALVRAGYSLAVDGDFGSGTEEALMGFQRANRVGVDGALGPQTRAALRQALAGQPEPPAPPEPDPSVEPHIVPKVEPSSPDAGLSNAGARFIAEFEGFRAGLYDDAASHCTIGYGHLVHRGPTNGSEPAEFRRGIDRGRALELLKADAGKAAAAVQQSVRVALNQAQRDALISFTFNLGAGALGESTLLKLLNQGDYDSVPAQLNRWVNAGGRTLPGLVRRRKAEGAMFASGQAGGPSPILPERSVLELQQRLSALGFDPGPLNGRAGPSTEAAVRAFQQGRGLGVDGIVGPLTEAALAEVPSRIEASTTHGGDPNGERAQTPSAGASTSLREQFERLSAELESVRRAMAREAEREPDPGEGSPTLDPLSALGGEFVDRLADRLGWLLGNGPTPVEHHEPSTAGGGAVVVERPATPPSTLRIVDPPARGAEVTEVQARLRELGYDPGLVDGIFGPGTARAVSAFQREHALIETGAVEEDTRRALAAARPRERPRNDALAPRIVTARSLELAFANLFGALGAEVHVTGHYSAGARAENAEQGIARAREFHAHHRGKGWGGIGYHYLITDDGTLICARPTLLKGAHTGGHNTSNIGVNMPGTTGDRPTDAQAASYGWLLANAHTEQMPKAHRTDRDLRQAKRFGHNQWSGHRSNGCPGLFRDMFVEGG
jgi:peptidoglycan hydrolase-like protein with peptidoglycan-binding domain